MLQIPPKVWVFDNINTNIRYCLLPGITVKPRKFELPLFEILANSKWIWDLMDPENRDYL